MLQCRFILWTRNEITRRFSFVQKIKIETNNRLFGAFRDRFREHPNSARWHHWKSQFLERHPVVGDLIKSLEINEIKEKTKQKPAGTFLMGHFFGVKPTSVSICMSISPMYLFNNAQKPIGLLESVYAAYHLFLFNGAGIESVKLAWIETKQTSLENNYNLFKRFVSCVAKQRSKRRLFCCAPPSIGIF